MGGVGFLHRKLFQYLSEMVQGDGPTSVPSCHAGTFLVGFNTVRSSLVQAIMNSAFSSSARQRVTVLNGDPFKSELFSCRFERAELPGCVGGSAVFKDELEA